MPCILNRVSYNITLDNMFSIYILLSATTGQILDKCPLILTGTLQKHSCKYTRQTKRTKYNF